MAPRHAVDREGEPVLETADYLKDVRRQFGMYRGLAEKAMVRLNDKQFFEVVGEDANSVAHIVKHMAGNLRSRWTDFLNTDGEKPDRHRDQEFEITPEDSRRLLMERWEDGWSRLDAALDISEGVDLGTHIRIRSEPHTILQAINRQLTHNACHVGQIILLARYFTGSNWVSLSVARGQSDQFNESMRAKYDSNK